MGLFTKDKKVTRQPPKIDERQFLNIKDKKFRRELATEFESVVKKEDVAKIMDDLHWASVKQRLERMPARVRKNMLMVMIKNYNKLQPEVRANLARYMRERYGVVIGKRE